MSPIPELKLAETLTSCLVYELIGIVGSLNNGFELMEDEAFDCSPEEALELIQLSTEKACTLIRLIRMAYGIASPPLSDDLSEIREVAELYLTRHVGPRCRLHWTVDPLPTTRPRGVERLILSLIALARYSHHSHDGTASVSVTQSNGKIQVEVMMTGIVATLDEQAPQALSGELGVDELRRFNVQAFFTGQLVQAMGGRITFQQTKSKDLFETEPDDLRLTVNLPKTVTPSPSVET